MIFRGYIDESYDNAQKLFALLCLISTGKYWARMERSWKLHVAAVNRKLKQQGRPLISRYHASDCSSRRNEFDGWTYQERDDFVLGLFGIFTRIPIHTVAFDVDLDELSEVFPEWGDDRLKTAYGILTRFVMFRIGEDFDRFNHGRRGNQRVTLFHDRTAGNGRYDPTILEAFNFQMSEWAFGYKSYFTTIAPLAWEDCIALQPADLVSFEVFKEAQAKRESRRSRKSYGALLDLKTFGIHKGSFRKDAMQKLRGRIEEGKV